MSLYIINNVDYISVVYITAHLDTVVSISVY